MNKWKVIIQGYEGEVVFAEIHEEDPKEFTIIIKNVQKSHNSQVFFPHQYKNSNTLKGAKQKVFRFYENYLKGIKGKPWKAWYWENYSITL